MLIFRVLWCKWFTSATNVAKLSGEIVIAHEWDRAASYPTSIPGVTGSGHLAKHKNQVGGKAFFSQVILELVTRRCGFLFDDSCGFLMINY